METGSPVFGSAPDGDDGSDAANSLFEWLFDADPQCRKLGWTIGAGALHGNPYGAVAIDPDQLDVSAIGDERGSDAVEPGFDDFSAGRRIIPCLNHLGPIGTTS